MLEIAIMIEAQDGLTWMRWQKIAHLVEELGFIGLYRSDHFTNPQPPDHASLELWTSLTWLAAYTKRIEFGPLVTPFSFRHPVQTARMAAAVDDLSNGRLTLGLGAGWQEREHKLFGFELLSVNDRLDRFEEGVQVVTGLLKSDTPTSFEGKYFQLRQAVLLPRPHRPGGPKILIGGSGQKRTLPLAARYADEWNCVYTVPQDYTLLNKQLDALLKTENRDLNSLKRSMMTGCYFGKNENALREKISSGDLSFNELRERGAIVGNPAQVKEQLQELAEVGLQRVMLQWLDLDDLDGLEALAKAVL